MTTGGPARDELKETFSTVAREYARGRPCYGPEAVIPMLADQPVAAAVIDLGAGSGQLSLPLADAGANVTAVEPLAPARAILADAIGTLADWSSGLRRGPRRCGRSNPARRQLRRPGDLR